MLNVSGENHVAGFIEDEAELEVFARAVNEEVVDFTRSGETLRVVFVTARAHFSNTHFSTYITIGDWISWDTSGLPSDVLADLARRTRGSGS